MRKYEFSAKTIDKAIKLGLETLGKKQEEVDIKIIEQGGFFKKAKIEIIIEDEPLATNFRKSEPKVKTVEKIVEDIVENKSSEPKIEEKSNQTLAKPQKVEQPEAKVEEAEIEHLEPKSHIEVAETEPIEVHETKKRERTDNNSTSLAFIKGLLDKMGVVATVELKECRDSSNITIDTEDAGHVIGYRGDCLNSIQYLANVIEQKHNHNAKRVVVDAGDYKIKREESLRALAIKIAGKVEATGRAYKFKPMNAYERRIIHTELQNYSSVETHSEGEEPNRRLVVTRISKR